MQTFRKGRYVYFFLALSLLILSAYYFVYYAAVIKEGSKIYVLKPGTSKKAFVNDLAKQEMIAHPQLLNWFIYTSKTAQLKTGEYLFPAGSSLASIWKQVTTGKGLVNHSFMIVPGWSFVQLREALARAPSLRSTISKLTDAEIMERLGYRGIPPEGEFFPETYNYTYGIQDLVILKRAVDLMQVKLTEAWEKRATNLPYPNPYAALIAASMIEKEAYLDAERSIIASVLVNRLKKNMLLQFDPTVIYGMGKRYQGKIYKENLTEDTLYNTYLHKGLPPTPIAMPNLNSIEAALHPQPNKYLYFVARGDGSHQFSETLLAHQAAVDSMKYQSAFFNERLVEKYLRPHVLKISQKRLP